MLKIFKWLMLVGSVLAVSSIAQAQETRRRVRMTPQLALAVLTVSEAGWDADADMRGIHAVILRTQQRQGGTYVEAAQTYARRLIGQQGEINRPWLWGLNPQGREPEQWPTEVWVTTRAGSVRRPHARWSLYRERWLNTYARAGVVVQYTLDTWSEWGPCSTIPDDWGGEMDMERARRIGLVQLSCGETENYFFIRPSTIAASQELGG